MEQTSERDCSYENEQKCVVKFVYGFDSDGGRRVRVKREPDCPDPVPVLALGLGNCCKLLFIFYSLNVILCYKGLLGALVLAGLILLLFFRISTYLYDKREYARFLNERENAKWSRVSFTVIAKKIDSFIQMIHFLFSGQQSNLRRSNANFQKSRLQFLSNRYSDTTIHHLIHKL